MDDRLSEDRARKRTRTSRAVALLLLLAGALASLFAGCGSSQDDVTKKPAAAILAASASAARQASSVRVLSQFKLGKTTAGFELQLAGEEGGLVRSSLGPTQSEVIRAGNTAYVKVGTGLAEQIAKATGAHLAIGSWLQGPVGNSQISSSAFLTKPDGELVFLLKNPALSLTKGAVTKIHGQKAIELKTKGKLYSGKIYIAAAGKPYPIEIIKQGKSNSRTTFSRWNAPITLPPPPSATSLASLEHKAG